MGRLLYPVARPNADRRPNADAATSRDAALDYLRAFVTVLVVAHHSVLAYALISPNAAPRSPLHPWLAGIPNRGQPSPGRIRPIRAFQRHLLHVADVLPFGAFVEPSLARKGSGNFLRDRALRLGVRSL